jgi:hypothetical protein
MDRVTVARPVPRTAIAVSALVVGVFAVWVSERIGGSRATLWVDDGITPLAALAGCLACVRTAARERGRMRTFWSLFAAAMAFWTLAELTWGYYALIRNVEVPVPSWADVGYLSAIPLALAALAVHPATHGSTSRRTRWLLDGLVLATSLLFLSWTLGLDSLWHSADLTRWSGVVSVAYPFGDIVIVFFIVLAIRGTSAAGTRQSLWWLLGALLAMAVSDSAFTYLTASGSYSSPGLLDDGWVLAYLGVAVAACAARPGEEALADRATASPSLASLVAPLVPVLVALVATAIEIKLGHHLDRTAWVMALVLVLLVLGRQIIAMVELLGTGSRGGGGVIERLGQAALRSSDYSEGTVPIKAAGSYEPL